MGMLMNKSGRFRIFLLSTSSGLMILDCWTLVEVCAPSGVILVLDGHPDLDLSPPTVKVNFRIQVDVFMTKDMKLTEGVF